MSLFRGALGQDAKADEGGKLCTVASVGGCGRCEDVFEPSAGLCRDAVAKVPAGLMVLAH